MPTNESPYPSPDRSFDDTSLVWLTGDESFAGLTASEILVYEFVADVGPVHSSDIQEECEPWGRFPDGPERREAKAATLDVMHASVFVSDADLPADRVARRHRRLELLRERFPDAVDTERDRAVIETAVPLVARSPGVSAVPEAFLAVIPELPTWWSEADAQAYSDAVASGDTEAARTLLVGLAYTALADHAADGSGREVPA